MKQEQTQAFSLVRIPLPSPESTLARVELPHGVRVRSLLQVNADGYLTLVCEVPNPPTGPSVPIEIYLLPLQAQLIPGVTIPPGAEFLDCLDLGERVSVRGIYVRRVPAA